MKSMIIIYGRGDTINEIIIDFILIAITQIVNSTHVGATTLENCHHLNYLRSWD